MSILIKKSKSIKCIHINNLRKVLTFIGDYHLYDGVPIKEQDGSPVECTCITNMEKPDEIEERLDGSIFVKIAGTNHNISDYENQSDFMIISYVPKLPGEVIYYELPRVIREHIKKVSPSSRRFLDVAYEQKIEISNNALEIEANKKNLEAYLECKFGKINVYEKEQFFKKYKTEDVICFEVEDKLTICCSSKSVTIQQPYIFIIYKENELNKLAVLFSENEKKLTH